MSRSRVVLQPAWVLHVRNYRDTSLLLEVFCRDHGRVGLVARGARRPRARQRALLQVLQPLLLSWQGGGELLSLLQAEAGAPALRVQGEPLFAALYANELLLRLLARHDPHPQLFISYAGLLQRLAAGADTAVGVRLFERDLLRELGYALNLAHDAAGSPVTPTGRYHYDAERGIVGNASNRASGVAGASLLALAEGKLDAASALELKPLLQAALRRHLGERDLQTPRMLRALRSRLGTRHSGPAGSQ